MAGRRKEGGPRSASALPLYMQVRQTLVGRIEAGVYPVGTRLPSEAELARELDVGTATVKQAIGALATAGIVTRRPSQGTFVAARPVEPGALPLRSFTEAMRERGLRVHSRVLLQAIEPVPAAIAWQLDASAGEPSLHLRRLRLALERPVALEETYIPLDVIPSVHPDQLNQLATEAIEGSLSQLLEDRYGLTLIAAEESVWAQTASAEQVKLLQLPAGSPVLVAERITEISGHQRGMLTHTVYRADAYQLHFRLNRYASPTQGESPAVGLLPQAVLLSPTLVSPAAPAVPPTAGLPTNTTPPLGAAAVPGLVRGGGRRG